jgi:predicted homoserine dehydrogenase-like protein
MVPAVVADLSIERALAAYQAAGYPTGDVRRAESQAAAVEAIHAGRPVAVPDGALLADLPLDAVVDSTGLPEVGATIGARCLRAGQHLIMVNVEADSVVGPALRRLADQAAVVYTLADGDQPSLICSLADWAAALGLRLVAGGKGTTLFPADHPRRIAAESDPEAGLVDRAYLDGTKSQIEMAAAANVLGWGVDARGLRHPSARLEEVATLLGPREQGGLLTTTPVIDFVNCQSPDGETLIEPHLVHGVFVVVTSDRAETLRAMAGKGVLMSADGSRALLWRPYHLIGVETPFSIAQAVLFGAATAGPPRQPTVAVVAVAKRDLPVGTALDGIGGLTVRGEAELAVVAARERLLPVGLAEGVRLARPVQAGTTLSYDDLAAPGDTACWRLLAEHDLLPAASGERSGAGQRAERSR